MRACLCLSPCTCLVHVCIYMEGYSYGYYILQYPRRIIDERWRGKGTVPTGNFNKSFYGKNISQRPSLTSEYTRRYTLSYPLISFPLLCCRMLILNIWEISNVLLVHLYRKQTGSLQWRSVWYHVCTGTFSVSNRLFFGVFNSVRIIIFYILMPWLPTMLYVKRISVLHLKNAGC